MKCKNCGYPLRLFNDSTWGPVLLHDYDYRGYRIVTDKKRKICTTPMPEEKKRKYL